MWKDRLKLRDKAKLFFEEKILRRGRKTEVTTSQPTEWSPKFVPEPVPSVEVPQVKSSASLVEATLDVMKRYEQGRQMTEEAHTAWQMPTNEFDVNLIDRQDQVDIPAWNILPWGKVYPSRNTTVFSNYKNKEDGTRNLTVRVYDESDRRYEETYSFETNSDQGLNVVYDRRWSMSNVPNQFRLTVKKTNDTYTIDAKKGYRGSEGFTPVGIDELEGDIFFRMNHFLQLAAKRPATAYVAK